MSGTILTSSAVERLRRSLRDTDRRPVNKLPPLERMYRNVPVIEKCPEVDVLNLFGPITGGTVKLTYKINDVANEITLQWDTDASDAASALAGHSQIGLGDIDVIGGPWPTLALHVIWRGDLEGMTIMPPAATPALTGGGTFHFWKASSVDWKGYAA